MRDRLKSAIAVALMVMVVAILIAPALSSPATALRAKRFSSLVYLAIAMAGTALAGILSSANARRPVAAARIAFAGPDVIDLTSARLC